MHNATMQEQEAQHLLAPALLEVGEHVKCCWSLQTAVHVVPRLPRSCKHISVDSLHVNSAHLKALICFQRDCSCSAVLVS